jgi:DNA-binding transcriptional regulator YiaG
VFATLAGKTQVVYKVVAMRLPDYIDQVGVQRFAKQFKVKPRTVQSWKRMERRPRAEKAQEIVEKTPVTMEGIYGA